MGYGGFSPYPRKLGGGDVGLKAIFESLQQQRGTAYDTTYGTAVWCENMAIARMIRASWGTNQRLASQDDPYRMSEDFVVRWEKILNLTGADSLTVRQRRDRIAELKARFGRACTLALMTEILQRELGDVFVQVETISVAEAHIEISGGGSYTFAYSSDAGSSPWSSSVAHVLVLTQVPANYTEGQYYDAVARVHVALDPILPAWATIDWYRTPLSGGIAVAGGPSEGGFFLDDAHNLDNNVFDV